MNDFPIEQIRKDFPILDQLVYGKPLAYLDNGATTQKPLRMIEAVNRLHREQNASVHRSVSFLSDKITQAYEEARTTVQKFIGASKSLQIIFTSGTTGSINLVAFSFGEGILEPGDEIIISTMEHHSNIVPWQMVCERHGARLRIIPITDEGDLDLDAYQNLFSDRTRMVAVTHVSNVLGTINPVKEIVQIAHSHRVPILLDGAQGVQHEPVNVVDLDCDFYVFSGHKIYGPTGIGILYGKEEWLERLPPYQGGGDMIDRVTFEKTTYNGLPFKFEAGTTNFIGAIGLAESLNYLTGIGLDKIIRYEHELRDYATQKLSGIKQLRMYGTSAEKAAIFSFVLEGIHPFDTGMIIDKFGVAVRTGTHCTMPLMQRFGIEGTVRASLCLYNTTDEIDRLHDALNSVIDLMA
ncbi:MAG: cysteine desulfurase [Porphyromonadaceae bacterium]|nr:MAG: cysteine desulfurase [Porphyromonadaceae bacterium]